MSVLAAAALEALLVRPSRRTCEAAFAAGADVALPGVRWDRALAAAVLDLLPVSLLRRTEDAFEPTDFEVVSPFLAMNSPPVV